MSTIRFNARLFKIGSWTLLALPKNASMMLPSRALTMVRGTINDFSFKAVLEPDGRRSHWFRIDETMSNNIKAEAGDTVKMEIEPSNDWIEPDIPADLKKALTSSQKAQALWKDTTPNAHWDWIRWIRATRSDETRKRRIGIGLSKLKAGIRRPCCFNRNLCSEPSVSNNGVLLASN